MLESAIQTLHHFNAFITVPLKLEPKLALLAVMVIATYLGIRRTVSNIQVNKAMDEKRRRSRVKSGS
jgi:hypothetical protein